MALTYAVKGTRGKSKAAVQLTVDSAFGAVVLHVWEPPGLKITHSFHISGEFARAFARLAEEAGLLGKPLIDLL